MARNLNGRLRFVKAAGRSATWFIPAVLGVVSVATASPEERVRIAFEEGFGVLGGAAGTKLGVGAGLGIVAVLGLGPIGLFVSVFDCASLGGIFVSEIGKKFGTAIYDVGPQFNNIQIYKTPELFLESIR